MSENDDTRIARLEELVESLTYCVAILITHNNRGNDVPLESLKHAVSQAHNDRYLNLYMARNALDILGEG